MARLKTKFFWLIWYGINLLHKMEKLRDCAIIYKRTTAFLGALMSGGLPILGLNQAFAIEWTVGLLFKTYCYCYSNRLPPFSEESKNRKTNVVCQFACNIIIACLHHHIVSIHLFKGNKMIGLMCNYMGKRCTRVCSQLMILACSHGLNLKEPRQWRKG